MSHIQSVLNPAGVSKNSLVRRAIHLSWFTIIYNLIEGIVSIYFGLEQEAISLVGFGSDSLVEVASAMLVLWRFRGETHPTELLHPAKERRATFGIGILFLVLAGLVGTVSTLQLFDKHHPETTLPGVIIASISLSFMFFLWSAKKKVAHQLGSMTVLKDAHCSMACIQLSVILWIGSFIYLMAPNLWWVDSVAALALALLIAREGVEIVQEVAEDKVGNGPGKNLGWP